MPSNNELTTRKVRLLKQTLTAKQVQWWRDETLNRRLTLVIMSCTREGVEENPNGGGFPW